MKDFDPKRSDFGMKDRDAIQDLLEMVKQNNKMLKKVQAEKRNAKIFGAVKWIALIIFALWAWSLIQPVISSASSTIEQAQASFNGVSNSVSEGKKSLEELQTNLDKLQNLLPNFGGDKSE